MGKAIIKQLLKDTDNKIIVYSRDEAKQALAFGGNSNIIRIIGDVRDFEKLNITMHLHAPDCVIHTAALKRVDDMEFHPDECIKTNVLGSENVARSAFINNVKKCILVSTDKACQPVNVYGSSKFIAERIFTNYDYNSQTTVFASVRYGNVIASRGSFIPLWKSFIDNNQSFKVTSMDCSRFLFTLQDAVDVVLQALEAAQGGEVFVPKIKSYDMKIVIEALTKLCNKKKLNYKVTGMRPGEKIHEDMLSKTELHFTYEVDEKLLVVLPQYTNKHHSYTRKYRGREFNSSLHLESNIENLIDLLSSGLSQAA